MSVDLEERGNDTKIGFKHLLCVCGGGGCFVCVCVCVCMCMHACMLDVTSLGYGAVGFTGE